MPATSTIIITTSSVFRSYPWSNGIVLSENAHDRLRAALEGTGHVQAVVDMVLSLASQMDDMATFKIQDWSMRPVLHKFWGTGKSSVSAEESRMSLVQLDNSGNRSHGHLAEASQLLFRYRLLDIIGEVFDVPRHENIVPVPRIPKPAPDKLRVRLEKVFHSSLKDWQKLVNDFRSLYRLRSRLVPQQRVSSEMTSELSSTNKGQESFQHGLRILLRAHKYQENRAYNTVMGNIEVLVFTLWWFSSGFADFPSSGSALKEAIIERGRDLKLPPSSYEGAAEIAYDLKGWVTVMRNTFSLAVAISPLVVLCPKKWDPDSIRRDFIISRAVTLGNEKPKRLRETEKALWLALLNIASGVDDEKALTSFVGRLEEIDDLNGESVEADWFIREVELKVTTTEQLAIADPSPSIQAESTAEGSARPASKKQPQGRPESTCFNRKRTTTTKSIAAAKSRVANVTTVKRTRIRRELTVDLPLPAPPVSSTKPKEKRTGNTAELPPINEDPPETTARGERMTLFRISRDQESVEYEFKVSPKVAKLEYATLAAIQEGVTGLYKEGLPPHHLDSAMLVDYDPCKGGSRFFVARAETFEKLDGNQIQAIFRHRHILIPGSSSSHCAGFDREGLGTLGSLTAPKDIQVGSLRDEEGATAMLRVGTLNDLLIKDEAGNRRILNVLDLPMGGAPVELPPQYRNLASNEYAWQVTRGFPDMTSTNFPNDSTLWATAATQNATTWSHVDDHGMATVINVVAGKKYWVVSYPKGKGLHAPDNPMNSINAFERSSALDLDYEGVLLVPGDTLYMRPNTTHYVLTVEDAIIYGRHIYPSHCIQDSSSGIVHTFVLNYVVTNVLHDNLSNMLRRMMVMWTEYYFRHPSAHRPSNPHVPDVTTMSGLMDVVALGNLMELAHVLDRRSYGKPGIHWYEQQQIAMARFRYRSFQNWFSLHYQTRINGRIISPLSVFRRALVEFAAAVIVYMKKTDESKTQRVPRTCTASAVEERMGSLFRSNFPELSPCLDRLVEEHTGFFSWTGPSVTIEVCQAKRSGGHVDLDFQDKPIYIRADTLSGASDAHKTGGKRSQGSEEPEDHRSDSEDSSEVPLSKNHGENVVMQEPLDGPDQASTQAERDSQSENSRPGAEREREGDETGEQKIESSQGPNVKPVGLNQSPPRVRRSSRHQPAEAKESARRSISNEGPATKRCRVR